MADLPVLDPEEQRVLGSLLEKQRTVPASYPLSSSALRTACNQSSSRDPVVDYDERTVEEVARRLKQRELVRIVWSDTGRRTLKYHQVLEELLALDSEGAALLTVLLLRGAQSPGELRARTERLHPFADRDAVESALREMAAQDPPLVRRLDRRPREQDHRWIHLLGAPAPEAAPPVPAGRGGPERDARVRTSYDTVAAAYAEALVDELEHDLPFERWLLRRVAEAADGPVVEVGCGPGHVTAFLAAHGAQASGRDLSPAMVAEARRRFPGRDFEVGDLRSLMRPATSSGWAAVLAWYSLIHLTPSELPDALAALVRPLAPGGWLVLAMHTGAGVRSLDSWFDETVDLDFVLHDVAGVVSHAHDAGLVDVEWYHRGPVTGRGETTERLYVVARRPYDD